MLFRMRNRNEAVKLLTEVFPDRTHVTETERYFAKGLESAAPTVNEENKMPTVQNLSEVQRKCGVRGSDELHERNQRRQPQPPKGGGTGGSQRSGGGEASLLGISHQRRRGVVESRR